MPDDDEDPTPSRDPLTRDISVLGLLLKYTSSPEAASSHAEILINVFGSLSNVVQADPSEIR